MHKQELDGNASFSRFYMHLEVAKNTCNVRSRSVSWLGNFTAIKPLLQQQVLAGMSLSPMGIGAADLAKGAKLTSRMIPMHRSLEDSRIVYRSAIALKLAPLAQRSALDIANQIMASFSTMSQDTSNLMCLNFSVEVVSPGWINFRLSEQSLATWLQHLIQIPPLEERGEKSNQGSSQLLERNPQRELDEGQKHTQNLFPVQYAHARCCSLLRLAHRQGLIKLRDLDFKTLSWQLVEPSPIPWLKDDPETDTVQAQLRLVHPAELRLIAEIVDWLDEISDPKQRNWLKLVSAVSNTFDSFYSSCRIWGEVKTQNPKLAQARLGLVGVTQTSLRALLENQLDVSAPIEL